MIYNLVVETESKIIGKVDGSAVVIRETGTLPVFEKMQENMAVDPNLKLDCFKIQDKAKLLDVLSLATAYNTTGLLVSEKFKNLILSLNLHKAQFIPVEAEYKGNIINSYYLLHLPSYAFDFLDYNTIEWGKYWPGVPVYELQENYGKLTKADLIKLSYEYAGSVYEMAPINKYAFNNFDVHYWDMFMIGQFNYTIRVSERLKKTVEAQNTKGVYFSESAVF